MREQHQRQDASTVDENLTDPAEKLKTWQDYLQVEVEKQSIRSDVTAFLETFPTCGVAALVKLLPFVITLTWSQEPSPFTSLSSLPVQNLESWKKEEVIRMLNERNIGPAQSKWDSRIVFAPKSDGKLRFRVD